MPSILAHGRLINTDLGLTLFLFLTVYFWTKLFKKFSWFDFGFSGLFLGLSLASKYTAIMVIPILIILALAKIFFNKNNAKQILIYVGSFFGPLIIGFIIVWATYGFSPEVPPKPIDSLSSNINLWTNLNIPDKFDSLFAKVRPIMFPADFYKGFFLVGRHALAGHGSYLLGQTSNTGWWYYFPVAIWYKTPIPFFIFLILAVVFWRKLRAKNRFDEFALLAVPLIFLIISMFSKADMGIRHILSIFPFLAVLASRSINLVDFSAIKIIKNNSKKLIPALGFLILILWYLYSAVASYPNYLTYFNGAAGGPKNGYKILGDSNLDWGQDIFRIKKYLDENNIQDGYILYPWNGDQALEYYGINLKPLPWEGGENLKGYAVVSTTYYQLADLRWLDQYPREQITPGVLIFKID